TFRTARARGSVENVTGSGQTSTTGLARRYEQLLHVIGMSRVISEKVEDFPVTSRSEASSPLHWVPLDRVVCRLKEFPVGLSNQHKKSKSARTNGRDRFNHVTLPINITDQPFGSNVSRAEHTDKQRGFYRYNPDIVYAVSLNLDEVELSGPMPRFLPTPTFYSVNVGDTAILECSVEDLQEKKSVLPVHAAPCRKHNHFSACLTREEAGAFVVVRYWDSVIHQGGREETKWKPRD
ncbi:hypothetical protein BaRGS_00031062, partial [Batillaria attramentaria]